MADGLTSADTADFHRAMRELDERDLDRKVAAEITVARAVMDRDVAQGKRDALAAELDAERKILTLTRNALAEAIGYVEGVSKLLAERMAGRDLAALRTLVDSWKALIPALASSAPTK